MAAAKFAMKRWSPRVAIIGMGAVTAQGPTASDLWSGALSGRVAITPVQHVDMAGLSTKLGGEVDRIRETAYGYRRSPGFTERALDLALAAADEALAGLPEHLSPDRVGLVFGTCNAGLLSAREWLRAESESVKPHPALATLVTPQGLAENLAAAFRLHGPVLSVNTACASGANAIGIAADLLRLGRADAVLAAGADALSDVCFAGFNSLESLSPTPAAPYSGNRDGLSLGEGSGMLLLIRTDDAVRWEVPVVAEVAGYALSADGYHVTAPRPDGSGAANAISGALRRSGVEPRRVGYVNGHGTGTPKNDPAESKAIRLAFGEHADELLVSSTKSVIGHLLGAAGTVEAIVTAQALAERIAPPTAGYQTTDPECDLAYVHGAAAPFAADAAVSNNFAFAGANASLVLTRHDAGHQPPRPDFDDVVITGVAMLGPAGDTAASWDAYVARSEPCAGDNGVLDEYRLGRVEVDPDPYLSRRERRRMDRLSILSVISTSQALTGAGLTPGSENIASAGVIFGTGNGPAESMERFLVPLFADGPQGAHPGVFPNTVYNQAAGQVAMHLGLHGPTSTLSVGHATGSVVVGYAADLLAMGHADVLACTVTDTLTAAMARAYAAHGALSSAGGDDDGCFALAESSVSIVLERRSAAEARGARILGTVLGTGIASDATRSRAWDPRGAGMERAIQAAVSDAGYEPGDVSSLWTAAAGLRTADLAEGAALDRIFGSGSGVPRFAPKTVLGEPMGASGSLLLALALHARASGAAPAGPALVNSSSLGGTHASTLIA